MTDGEQAGNLREDELLSLLVKAKGQLERAMKLAQAGKHGPFIKRLQAMDALVVSAVLALPYDAEDPYRTLSALLHRVISTASRPELVQPSGDPSKVRRKRPSAKIQEAIAHLRRIADAIGPREPGFVFDPAAFRTIAHVIATAVFAQSIHPLFDVPDELGAGVYALFYTGPLPYYASIRNVDVPIYVGSAIPSKYDAQTSREQGASLAGRLAEHRKTIAFVESNREGGNLKVSDFNYRALVVRSGWELAAEQYLIRHFNPIWNKETKICFGFGKHGDDPITRTNARSPWDVLHPGRKWARTEVAQTPEQIQTAILEHFQKHPPRPIEIGDILHGS